MFSANEVCELIRVCGASRVVSLSYAGLMVQFEKEKTVEEKPEPVQHTHIEPSAFHPTTEKKPGVDANQVIDALDELMISDPAEYERVVTRGGLNGIEESES